MKPIFGLLSLLIAVSLAKAETFMEKTEATGRKCGEKFFLTEAEKELSLKDPKYVPESYKCFLNCMYDGNGLTTNGTVVENSNEFFDNFCEMVGTKKDSQQCKDYKECSKVTDPKPCEMAMKIADCIGRVGDKYAAVHV